MAVSAQTVNELRKRTDAGVMDCKKALEESGGDLERAEELLRKRGIEKADKKAGRETKEGTVYSYIHAGSRVGVLLELSCETDFVAKNELFQTLAKDLAMQVAAMKPRWTTRETVPAAVVEEETALFKEEAARTGKEARFLEKIADGKMEKWYEAHCLADQGFIKDEKGKLKVKDLVQSAVAKLGENITIRRFARFEVGEVLD
jgi:elongation factor Ts